MLAGAGWLAGGPGRLVAWHGLVGQQGSRGVGWGGMRHAGQTALAACCAPLSTLLPPVHAQPSQLACFFQLLLPLAPCCSAALAPLISHPGRHGCWLQAPGPAFPCPSPQLPARGFSLSTPACSSFFRRCLSELAGSHLQDGGGAGGSLVQVRACAGPQGIHRRPLQHAPGEAGSRPSCPAGIELPPLPCLLSLM